MKKKITPIILACLLLILEALPLGAALHIANPNGSHTVQFCSYFDLRTFGAGNFAPFVVAIISVILLVLCVLFYINPSKQLKKVIFFVACIAMLLSFCPLFYCMQCYTLVDCLVVFILFVLTMIFVDQAK